MQIHVLYMPLMDQMSIPMPMVSYVTGGQRTVIQNIETSETWRGQVRIVRWGSNVFYFTLTQSLSARLIFLKRNRTSDYPKDKVSFSPNTVEEETVTSATTVTTVTPSTSHEAIEDVQVLEEAEIEEEED